MSWGAQTRSKDAKTPSGSRGRLIKPELDCCPVQPYIITLWALLCSAVIAPVMSKRVLSKEVLAQKRATRPSGVTKSIVSGRDPTGE